MNDAYIDYSASGVIAGSLDDVVEFFRGDFSKLVSMSMHYITNIEADIAGDTAQVSAMFYNPTQIEGMAALSVFGGYYRHDLVHGPDGWRSRGLREEPMWTTNSPRGASDPTREIAQRVVKNSPPQP